ncbi:hypothetical protein PIB30_105556, partial [Stylosanthes scabra]|nr:hypothetical protein [Stylosanthes scabra]
QEPSYHTLSVSLLTLTLTLTLVTKSSLTLTSPTSASFTLTNPHQSPPLTFALLLRLHLRLPLTIALQSSSSRDHYLLSHLSCTIAHHHLPSDLHRSLSFSPSFTSHQFFSLSKKTLTSIFLCPSLLSPSRNLTLPSLHLPFSSFQTILTIASITSGVDSRTVLPPSSRFILFVASLQYRNALECSLRRFCRSLHYDMNHDFPIDFGRRASDYCDLILEQVSSDMKN